MAHRKPDHGLGPRDLQILREVLQPFAARIDRVCLFGSRATGTARPNSDIDLVIYGDLGEEDIDRLWTLFDASYLSVPVDVLAWHLVEHPALRDHIASVGSPLFSREDLAPSCADPAHSR